LGIIAITTYASKINFITGFIAINSHNQASEKAKFN